MKKPFNVPHEFLWEDHCGIRGCCGIAPFHLGRRGKDAAILLHEIPHGVLPNIKDAVFSTPIPDFNNPFVTSFLGTLQLLDRTFLLEPLPKSVPLISAWQTVLQDNPHEAGRMLQQMIVQLDYVLQQFSNQGKEHGAACAANVVLTTHGTYGLLAAHLPTSKGNLLLRDFCYVSKTARKNADLSATFNHQETIGLILQDLLAIETELAVLSIQDRRHLHDLCEPHMDTLQVSQERNDSWSNSKHLGQLPNWSDTTRVFENGKEPQL